MISLTGKSALITGGSRGIGAAAVRLFSQAGADVVFNYHRNRAAAERVTQEARKHGTRVESFKADLGNAVEGKRLVEFARDRLGHLDILVANAGIWNDKDIAIESMSEQQWDEMMRVNLKSVYSTIHHAVPHMIAQKSGKIVAVSSTAGQRGEANVSNYAASKGGQIAFMKSLSTELGPFGINVNCVAPGWVDTDMTSETLADETRVEAILKEIPKGRVATPEDIAGPVVFLCSEWAEHITGSTISVNGGSVL